MQSLAVISGWQNSLTLFNAFYHRIFVILRLGFCGPSIRIGVYRCYRCTSRIAWGPNSVTESNHGTDRPVTLLSFSFSVKTLICHSSNVNAFDYLCLYVIQWTSIVQNHVNYSARSTTSHSSFQYTWLAQWTQCIRGHRPIQSSCLFLPTNGKSRRIRLLLAVHLSLVRLTLYIRTCA